MGMDHFQIVIQEIERHLEDAEINKLQHYIMSSRYDKLNRQMETVIAILMSFLLIVLSSSFIHDFTPWNTVLATFASIVLALLTTIKHIGKYDEKAVRHWIAAQSYQRMWRTCKNWHTDFPDNSKIAEAVLNAKMLRERMTEINRDSPALAEWAWKKAQKQQGEGSTTYDTTDQGLGIPQNSK